MIETRRLCIRLSRAQRGRGAHGRVHLAVHGAGAHAVRGRRGRVPDRAHAAHAAPRHGADRGESSHPVTFLQIACYMLQIVFFSDFIFSFIFKIKCYILVHFRYHQNVEVSQLNSHQDAF